MDRPQPTAAGAYGLTFPGLEGCPGLVPSPDPAWPPVRVERRLIQEPPGPTIVEEDWAHVRLVGDGQLRLDRVTQTATFLTTDPLPDDELVHPYLAPVASFFAGWLGRQSLHAGGMCIDGAALAIAGPKEAGKTTTLAWLASEGFEILADDVLVVDGGNALAGPRALDLRHEAARELSLLDRTHAHRGGERRRLPLGPVLHERPLGGIVFLAWGPRVELVPLRPSERLVRIARSTSSRPGAGRAPLELARFPAWELRRPRSVAALPEALDRLLAVARG